MKKSLNEEELKKVSGGDHGDKELEFADSPEGVKFLYNVGDHVEVFVGKAIHSHTRGGTIVNRYTTYKTKDCENAYFGMYKVQYDDSGSLIDVDADRIERNI